MYSSFNEKLIAYLTLLSGLSVSAVAIYYSVAGLATIFAAAVIPIIIMGVALEISKLVATVWLKQNWDTAPFLIKIYLMISIAVLMLITSMGIFGFLSKSHSDQGLISGEVLAKVAVYDEKIKIARENIDVSRRALKQMDEAVDQVMGRSTTEAGANKAVQIRRGQAKERQRLLSDIEAEQKKITKLSEEKAPIAAEVRKVEAEVGPIKYIASFFYGTSDPVVLEKAVTWMIILIIVVFDPLALILLIASQISFQKIREKSIKINDSLPPIQELTDLKQAPKVAENITPVFSDHLEEPSTVTEHFISTIDSKYTEPLDIAEYFSSITDEKSAKEFDIKMSEIEKMTPWPFEDCPDEVNQLSFDFNTEPQDFTGSNTLEIPDTSTELEIPNVTESLYVQNEEQAVSNLWTSTTNVNAEAISPQEYLKISQENRDLEIAEMIRMVKEGRLQMADIPEELLTLIKARV